MVLIFRERRNMVKEDKKMSGFSPFPTIDWSKGPRAAAE